MHDQTGVSSRQAESGGAGADAYRLRHVSGRCLLDELLARSPFFGARDRSRALPVASGALYREIAARLERLDDIRVAMARGAVRLPVGPDGVVPVCSRDVLADEIRSAAAGEASL